MVQRLHGTMSNAKSGDRSARSFCRRESSTRFSRTFKSSSKLKIGTSKQGSPIAGATYCMDLQGREKVLTRSFIRLDNLSSLHLARLYNICPRKLPSQILAVVDLKFPFANSDLGGRVRARNLLFVVGIWVVRRLSHFNRALLLIAVIS